MKKYILVVVFSWGFPIAVFFGLSLLNLPRELNDRNSLLMCEHDLKIIWSAIGRYRADNDGRYPPSLGEVKPYLEEKYSGPDGVPQCPGSRGQGETGQSSSYIYHPPASEESTEPIAWDSRAHFVKRTTPRYNVLYSDGHVETLDEREFVHEMAASFADEPAVLGQIGLPDRPRDHRGRTFILGVIVGMTGLGLFLRITK